MVLLWDVIFLVPSILMAIGSRVISPLITTAVHKLMVTSSFGINQSEISFAHVYVDEMLDLKVHAPKIEHWNVQVGCMPLWAGCMPACLPPARPPARPPAHLPGI